MKTAFTLLPAFLIVLSIPSLVAQHARTTPNPSIGTYLDSGKWIRMDEDENISVANLWEDHARELGLTSQDEMVLVKTETDPHGWTHYRYQQFHRGVAVEHALFRIHAQDEKVIKGNGELAFAINVNTDPSLTEEEALAIALESMSADQYAWQDLQMEERKKFATDDPFATFYPEGQLLIVDEDHDGETPARYQLAWKFDIQAVLPETRKWIYIDAHDGTIVKELALDMHEHGFPATAVTRYSGVRQIVTDSTDQGYVLRDYSRARGVHTFDAQDSFDLQYATDFYDEDNHWDLDNDRANNAATDAHWGAEMYFDYLLDRHGINSYDNLGSKLICYVHVGQGWYNASWNGFWTRYGNAGGDPWTHIDVVGHEFTHGLTYAFPGLIYEAEAGALNESFSDILGEALQRYAHGGIVDWVATPSPVDTIRSYIDPNAFNNPDTYHGEFWEFGPGDNYGVHTNSGVQNHWFYLLSEGGTGTNDHGAAYEVEPIGFESAIDIVIRNITTYLFPTSDYFDARQGSLQAAEDLFGPCSFEYKQVANAWHAVGVGSRFDENDFTVLEVEQMQLCEVQASAPVKMQIKHMGCEHSGPVTLQLRIVKSNPVAIVNDSIVISDGLEAGEVFEYTSKELNFTKKGEHVVTVEVIASADPNPDNNMSKPVTIYNLSPVSEQAFPFHGRIALRTFKDSIAFITGEHTNLDLWFNAGRDSTYGIRIEGDRPSYARPVYKFKDPFDFNHRLGAHLCSCIDATTQETLELQFDLRQTYSSHFEETVGVGQPKTSVMRVLADGDELARYFPETNNEDPWQTHNLDLTHYLGREFILCFETRTLVSLDDDDDDIGDRVFLDNIAFIGKQTTGTFAVNNYEPLTVYPNPASEEIVIDIPSVISGKGEVTLLALAGKVLQSDEVVLIPGANRITIDVHALVAGIYFVEVRTEEARRVGKVVID